MAGGCSDDMTMFRRHTDVQMGDDIQMTWGYSSGMGYLEGRKMLSAVEITVIEVSEQCHDTINKYESGSIEPDMWSCQS